MKTDDAGITIDLESADESDLEALKSTKAGGNEKSGKEEIEKTAKDIFKKK